VPPLNDKAVKSIALCPESIVAGETVIVGAVNAKFTVTVFHDELALSGP
jgi:hypothetical protein